MSKTFLGARGGDADGDAIVLGAELATVYPNREPHAKAGAAAIRSASMRLAKFIGHYDFDTGRPFASWLPRIADHGDIATDRSDPAGNRMRIAAAVAGALARDAMPILIGGDDSLAEPFVAGWKDRGPVSVVQIDAHLDFRDEVSGEHHGYSSPMRRASEMSWVHRIVHVGQRGVGSARPTDVEDTLSSGNEIVTAVELASDGPNAVAARLDPGERFVVVYDVDGTDPSEVPAVRAPVSGGPGVADIAVLVTALATRGRLEGLAVTEFEPDLDIDKTSAATLARLVCLALEARLGD